MAAVHNLHRRLHREIGQKVYYAFPDLASGKWNRVFPNFLKKKDSLARKSQMFENFLPVISIPLIFLAKCAVKKYASTLNRRFGRWYTKAGDSTCPTYPETKFLCDSNTEVKSGSEKWTVWAMLRRLESG